MPGKTRAWPAGKKTPAKIEEDAYRSTPLIQWAGRLCHFSVARVAKSWVLRLAVPSRIGDQVMPL